MTYKLLEKDKYRFISLLLLNEIINQQVYPPINLTGEDIYLDRNLKVMLNKGLLAIKDADYVPTELGRTELKAFYDKYSEYLNLFDIFCAVDLESGTFAYEQINNPAFDDDRWFDYLSNERFSDVRVAVAQFKGINPIEIVFMSFLSDGKFQVGDERWQYNLTSNDVWNEIINVCNTPITKEYLDQDGVLENIVKQGAKLALELLKQAEQADNGYDDTFSFPKDIVTEEYVKVVDMPSYGYDDYKSYYDPYYVSQIWLGPKIEKGCPFDEPLNYPDNGKS
jgi:hypothetical protein